MLEHKTEIPFSLSLEEGEGKGKEREGRGHRDWERRGREAIGEKGRGGEERKRN